MAARKKASETKAMFMAGRLPAKFYPTDMEKHLDRNIEKMLSTWINSGKLDEHDFRCKAFIKETPIFNRMTCPLIARHLMKNEYKTVYVPFYYLLDTVLGGGTTYGDGINLDDLAKSDFLIIDYMLSIDHWEDLPHRDEVSFIEYLEHAYWSGVCILTAGFNPDNNLLLYNTTSTTQKFFAENFDVVKF